MRMLRSVLKTRASWSALLERMFFMLRELMTVSSGSLLTSGEDLRNVADLEVAVAAAAANDGPFDGTAWVVVVVVLVVVSLDGSSVEWRWYGWCGARIDDEVVRMTLLDTGVEKLMACCCGCCWCCCCCCR